MKIVEFRKSVFGHFYNDFYWFLGSNPQVDFVLLVTSTDSFSELRKYFLDRKKVLKSLEANSFISPENFGGWGSCRTKQHILKVSHFTKNACTTPLLTTVPPDVSRSTLLGEVDTFWWISLIFEDMHGFGPLSGPGWLRKYQKWTLRDFLSLRVPWLAI